MVRRFFFALLACITLAYAAAPPVSAETLPETKNKGLYVSPLRTYLSLDAGSSVTRSFTVANLTNDPMTVNIDVEQFSMVDYSYDYQFTAPKNDWVQPKESTLHLQPYESHEVAYAITLPKSAPPGGYYYTLFASSTLASGTTTSTIRAATLLYLTVKGDLTYTLEASPAQIPAVVIEPTIPYSFDVKNTGNIHYFALVSAEITGLGYRNAPNGTSQLLMPDATRHINASISAPLLPGLYKLHYTIVPDHGSTIEGSRYFVFLPPWSLALLSVITGIVYYIVRRRSKQRSVK